MDYRYRPRRRVDMPKCKGKVKKNGERTVKKQHPAEYFEPRHCSKCDKTEVAIRFIEACEEISPMLVLAT